MSASLGTVIREALTLWDQLKAHGASLEERQRGLEGVLRQAWPRGRPWQVLCATCEDTGLVMLACAGDASCGRVKVHGPHTWGKPCVCPKGAKFADKPKSPDDYVQAGKVPRGWARAGR